MISDCVDLHTHSTASDGSLSPPQLINLAAKIRLKAISITDHDTIEGCVEAVDTAAHSPVEVVPGVEISADARPGGMHLLGYLISLGDSDLTGLLGRLQEGREKRNQEMVRRLNDLGIDIIYDEVLSASGGGQTGRPHFAATLMNKGVVRSFNEAFIKYLGRDCPAYVGRFRPSPAEAIHAIRGAGGVAVLAHPSTLERAVPHTFESVLRDLTEQGLQGMEVYYPDHGPRKTARYEALARRYKLVATGGTDFHGQAKPGIYMGVGRGEMRIPYAVVETLKACRRENITGLP